ncbi:MAG: hypothetical protein R3236_04555, partial [Phycisphaeraceae bacterium]|nr:hypothetical protein [Phycisphaeraceae bacterium]
KGKKSVIGHSIRSKRYRYTEWWENGTDMTVDSVLTDLEADPGETTSVQGQMVLKRKLAAELKSRVLAARRK